MFLNCKLAKRIAKSRNPGKRLQHGAASIRTKRRKNTRNPLQNDQNSEKLEVVNNQSLIQDDSSKRLVKRKCFCDDDQITIEHLPNKLRKENEELSKKIEELDNNKNDEILTLKNYIIQLEHKFQNEETDSKKNYADETFLQDLENRLKKLREEKLKQPSVIRIIEPQADLHLNSNSDEHKEIRKLDLMEKFLLNQSMNQSISLLSKFSGTKDEDFNIWFDDFKSTLDQYPTIESNKIVLFKSKLQGDARYTFEGFLPNKVDTLEKAGRAMETVFALAHDEQEWIIKLNSARQAPSELIQVFGHRISRMVLKAYAETDEKTINKLSIDYFLRGINDYIGEKLKKVQSNKLWY